MSDYPRKAIEVKITVSGFDWDSVVRHLRNCTERVACDHENARGLSACGPSTSHTVDVHLRDVSPDQFCDESVAWLERRRNAPDAAKGEG